MRRRRRRRRKITIFSQWKSTDRNGYNMKEECCP